MLTDLGNIVLREAQADVLTETGRIRLQAIAEARTRINLLRLRLYESEDPPLVLHQQKQEETSPFDEWVIEEIGHLLGVPLHIHHPKLMRVHAERTSIQITRANLVALLTQAP